jgi:hypothetical protein
MKGFATAIRQGGRGLRVSAAGILIILPVIGTFAATASATVLSGSLRSSLYLQESRFGADSYETRVTYPDLTDPTRVPGSYDTTQVPESRRNPLRNRARLAEEVRLDALQLGVKPLGFHTSFTAGNVLTDQSLKETAIRLHRAYFQWNGMRRRPGVGYDVRLGRHWVIAGVGTSVVDGLSAKLADPRFGDLTGFGGTLGSDRIAGTKQFWSLDKTSRSLALGGRLRLERALGPVQPQLAVSAAQTQRTDRLHTIADPALIPEAAKVTDTQRLGVSAELRASRTGSLQALRGLRAWGDYRHDLLWSRTLSAVGGIDYYGTWRGLRGRIEYGERRPDLRGTSHFVTFAGKTRHELRGGAGTAVTPQIRIDVEGDYITSPGTEKENGFALTTSGYGLSVGYRFNRGYGGNADGFILNCHREVIEKLSLDATFGYLSFDYGDTPEDPDLNPQTQEDTSGLLAADYRLLPNLTLTGQVEGLRNGGMNKDLRFLGIVHWRFRTAL